MEQAFEEPPNKKRTKIFFCLLLGVVVVVLFVIYPREPSYEGKSVSEWLDVGSHEILYGGKNVVETHLGNAMQNIGSPAVPHLLKAMSYRESQMYQFQRLLNNHQPFVRFKFGDKKIEQTYAAALAYVVLGERGRPGFPVLTNWLFNPTFAKTATSMMAACALAGTEQGVQVLIQELSHPDLTRRFIAADALGQAPWQEKVADELTDVLIKGLTDPERAVRNTSARSLGQFRHFSPEVIAALLHSLKDTHWLVRHHSAYALGRSIVPRSDVIQALTEATSDDTADVRYTAAWAIEELQSGTEFIQPLLLESLHMPDSYKQWNTIVALGTVEPQTKT